MQTRIHTILAATSALMMSSAFAGTLTPQRLRCEYLVDPLGIDRIQPRLSWELNSMDADARGLRQSAYQVWVASSRRLLTEGDVDLWDSGQVSSDETVGIVYAGKKLESRSHCYWKVRVWDQDAQESPWSEAALWTVGLLKPSDWKAEWIGDAGPTPPPMPPHFGYRSRAATAATKSKWVQLDMLAPTVVDGVRLHGTRKFGPPVDDVPGYLFPVRFRLEVASRADFGDARTVVDRTRRDVLNPGVQPLTLRFPATTARYVRLVVTKMRIDEKRRFGVALAELELLDGTVNRSRGAPVTASDSVENEPWSVHKLTDGDIFWHPGGDVAPMPPPLLRREFILPGGLRRATAFATALGVYEMRINGQKVGDRILAPEWTDYNHIVQYQTYDVTPLLRPGDNAVGVMLGDGWYAGRIGMSQSFGAKRLRGVYGRKPQFCMQLHLEFDDGSSATISTDERWQSTTRGPIRSADLYDGEIQDARMGLPGWDQPGYDDALWNPVEITHPMVDRVAQMVQPIRVQGELTAQTVTESSPGVYVFDLAQNVVGRSRLRVRGRAGDRVILRHGEALTPDGILYAALHRGAAQKDEFLLRGDPQGEVLATHFTYHGFRYVEVTGLRRPPVATDLTGVVFHTAAPQTGSFETSSPLVNRLWKNILWTQRGNMMSVFTDCPQRDERLGWLGDYQMFAPTGCYNMDLAAFINKTARDMRLAQSPDGNFPSMAPNVLNFRGDSAWGDAGVLVPWLSFVHFADDRLLAEHFDAARRWVDGMHRQSEELVLVGAGPGDWLNGDRIARRGWPARGATPSPEVFGTAHFAHSARLVAQMAEALGREAEANHYQSLFAGIRAEFQKRFVAADGRMRKDNQSSYAMALRFDLVPEKLRPAVAGHLVEAIRRYGGHLSTGTPTTHLAMLQLSCTGHNDVAYRLLNQREPPSWGYMIDQGATTIWERWDSYIADRRHSDYTPSLAAEMEAPTLAQFQTASMNSLNHPAFGSVGQWLYSVVLGLEPSETEPGYRSFFVRPQPGGGLTYARGAVHTVRGRIAVDWTSDQEAFRLRVTVPPNTSATVTLPVPSLEGVTESGKPLRDAGCVRILDAATHTVYLQSGRYEFTIPRP